mgnify:CR=1 FL=1
MSDLHYLTLAESADLVRTKKLSPVELTDALLKRIETFNPQLSAFITITGDLARAQAKQAEQRGEVPVGQKPYFEIPLFNWHQGHLSAIYQRQYIDSAQRFLGGHT